MEFCLDYFCEKNQKENFSKEEIKKNIKCLQRLKMACDQSKKYLSLKIALKNGKNAYIISNNFNCIKSDFFNCHPLPIIYEIKR